MSVTLPFVLVLGVAVWAVVRYLNIRLWVAVLIGLFGFYPANTFLAPVIDDTARSGVDVINNTQQK